MSTKKEFHFSLGNSTKGACGFCAVVRADSATEAAAILRDRIVEECDVPCVDKEDGAIVYIRAYFNPDAIRPCDADEVTENEYH